MHPKGGGLLVSLTLEEDTTAATLNCFRYRLGIGISTCEECLFLRRGKGGESERRTWSEMDCENRRREERWGAPPLAIEACWSEREKVYLGAEGGASWGGADHG